ncbi:hypothetical protein DFH08DRAFT_803313 [Mycena albidolilacea]|uniref:Uncharacterized protein n=1 Tax=Mycena albidolilacea TaxID=1033008 RepID=A0AAD7ADX1_9AGAR|nr:hypothetical protein DFH08DRAFT_803313 [Mycena albidolilacea]
MSSPAYSPSSFDPDDMPASNQTPRTSACGLPLPLPADFDFRSYCKTPAELVVLDDMSLHEKNADNCPMERANDASLHLTRAYEAAARSPAGVGDLDVGARLQPFFSYSEKALLFTSKDVVDASGPLPLYMTMWIAGQRVLAAKGEAEEKKKRDEIKANPAGQTLKGAVPVGPTHRISSLAMSESEIPNPFLGCLVQKIPVPLHWWTNSNLTKANNSSHWLPWRELMIEGKKILILETAKGEKILGDAEDEFKNLSPGKWREALVNFARALWIMSQEDG